MKIEYPTPQERQASIHKACSAALRRQETLPRFLTNMVKEVGWRNLFYDMYDVMLAGLLLFLLLFGGIYLSCMNDLKYGGLNVEAKVTCTAFLSSPLLYMTFFFITQWKEQQSGTYELKMACKYTANHLVAFRMFVFSLLSVVLNAGYLALLCGGVRYDLFTAFSISFSSLFFFSLLLICVLLRFPSRSGPLIFSFLWLGGNLAAMSFAKDVYILLAQSVPGAVYLAIGVLCVGLYGGLLTNLTTNRKGRNKHAYNS